MMVARFANAFFRCSRSRYFSGMIAMARTSLRRIARRRRERIPPTCNFCLPAGAVFSESQIDDFVIAITSAQSHLSGIFPTLPPDWSRGGRGVIGNYLMNPREFDGWLKANAVLGSMFAIGMLAMALAGLNSEARPDGATELSIVTASK